MARGTKRLAELRKRRYQAARLFQKGERQATVARLLRVSRQSVSRWYRQWLQGGTPDLRGSTRAGRPPRLQRDQRARVRKALLEGARAQGWATDLWTLPRVAKMIESVTGVHYHAGHVWRVMKDLGWSLQRPAVRAKERDERAIERRKRTTGELVEKETKRRGPG